KAEPKAEAKAEETTEAQAEAEETTEALAEATGAVVEGEYGEGSAAANEDGSQPAGYDIKGNKNSMKYHTTESPWYDQTVAEVWFDSEEAAEKAGFEKAGE
ncbi:MAG TPA: 50S ribosomal protein L17, partial [Kribbellaceae bacterium]